MANVWDVYKVKKDTMYETLRICADKYIVTDCALPVEFMADKSVVISKPLIIVKEFQPENSLSSLGIATYVFTKEQFEEAFEYIGNYQDFINIEE